MKILLILASVLLSGTIVAYLIPKVLVLSLKKKLVDPIDPRKIHNTIASRLGGVTFFPAIFISFTICFALLNMYYETGISMSLVVMIDAAAALMLYLVGMFDDLIGVRYRDKFIVQILTALVLVLSGTYLKSFYLLDSTLTFPLWFTFPLTILLVVFITNAINLIDGINGLASMLSIIALIVFGIILFVAGDYLYSAISLTTVGALIPFWYFNVFGVRKRTTARVFMGDCGALVIGFTLSVMAIKVWNITGETKYISSNICHVLAYSALFVPCIDVIRVILTRIQSKKSPFLPDNNHIHHRFMRLGVTPRRTLWIVLSIQIGFIGLNLILSPFVNILLILAIDIVVWTVMHIMLTKRIINTK